MSDFKKLPPLGFAHFLLPLLMVAIIAIVGGYVLMNGGSAATATGAVYLESDVTGKCLDDHHDSATNGIRDDSYECNQSEAQQWTLNTNGTIENPNGKCIDNDYGKNLNNNPITVYTCSATNTAEQWTNAGNILKNPATGKCIDDPYASATNGTELILYTCNSKKQQIWTAVKTTTSTGTGSTTTGSGTSGGGNGGGTTSLSGCSLSGVVAPCMNGTNTGAGATGWGTPTFDDEFNGTSVNTNNWNVEGPRAPNNGQEEDCYSPTTVSESGGDLNIALLNQSCTIGSTTYKYTGGQIDTNDHFNPTYGYFEARMYTPGSNGQISNWPAWWMFGPNWPSGSEIDTFEGFHGYAGWHFCFPDPTACDWQGNYQSTQDFTGWHTYAVDWQPTSIIYYYDGVKVGTLTTGASTANQPMQLVIDNTTGPLDNQAGPLVVPATIKVDYVRAWK